MATEYSCYLCGDDVEEDAATMDFWDIGEMPVCEECRAITVLTQGGKTKQEIFEEVRKKIRGES